MGSGGALFDFDNDDDLDLYLVQGNSLSVSTEPPPKNRLYRNDSGIFVDITESANVGDTGYGLGAVAADYDSDGNRDLYITNLGKNVLYRNNGDGTFTDVTQQAQVGCPLLSASAAFADIDRDGDLDLYVCNYVEYALETDIPCYYKNTLRIYCGPNEYHGIADVLYRNNSDGTFTDITKSAGVYEPTTRGLGVVFTDVNRRRLGGHLCCKRHVSEYAFYESRRRDLSRRGRASRCCLQWRRYSERFNGHRRRRL